MKLSIHYLSTTKLHRYAKLVLVACALLGSGSLAAEEYNFRVFLNDKEVGHQHMQVERDGDKDTVSIDSKLNVKVLFVNAYSYEHTAKEVWQDQCLQKLDSKTNENGDKFFVTAIIENSSLKISNQDGKTAIDACVRSFAYWDIERLNTDKLLNAQTGKQGAVEFSDEGSAKLDVQGKSIDTLHYVIRTDESDINVYYDNDNAWVALTTKVKGGRTLAYFRTPQLMNEK